MLSSEQVAALMAAQQQRNAMLQAAGQGGYLPSAGASQYPPTFSYGQQGPGVAARGAALMGAGIQAVPAAAMAASGVAGVASMFGVQTPMTRFLTSPMFDPIGHGVMTGARAAGASLMAGEGIFAAAGAGAAGASAMLPPAALALAAYGGIRKLGQGFGDYSAMQGSMSNYRFANAAAPGGRGFSHSDLSSIMGTMRDFDRADAFTTFGDTQRMLQGFTEMGMGQGVRDAKEFSSKLKKMMGTVREIAKMTGTTIDDALSTFGQMRQSGFFTAQDVMGNTANMARARGYGISAGSYIGAQQAGASLYRSSGLGGMAGARQMTGNAEALLASGVDAERIMDTFDAEDAASGSLKYGRRITAGLANFYQNTAMGRASLMAFGEMRDGEFTGGLSASSEEMRALGAGGVSARAGARQRSDKAAYSFLGREQDIATAMLKKDDALVTAVRQIQETTRNRGGDGAARELIRSLMGLSERESQMVLDVVNSWERTSRELQQRRVEELRAERYALRMRQDYSLAGLGQQISGGLADAFSPIAEAGSTFSSRTQGLAGTAWNRFMGISPNQGGLEREGVRSVLAGEFGRLTTASGQQVGRDFNLQDAAARGRAESSTFDYLGDARNSPAVQAAIRRLKEDQAFQKSVRAAIISGSDEDRASVSARVGFRSGGEGGMDLSNYILTEAGGGVLAARNIRDAGVSNSLYRAMAGESVTDVAQAAFKRTSRGFFDGSSWGSAQQQATDAYLSLDSTSMQGLMQVLAEKGGFGGGEERDLFSTTMLAKSKESPDTMREDTVAELNARYGTCYSFEEWQNASILAQREKDDAGFAQFARDVASAARRQGGYQVLEAAKSNGFGGLGRTAAGSGVMAVLETALAGESGAALSKYGALLGSDTTDLSGFAGDPYADLFMQQRAEYKKYRARGAGAVDERELFRTFGVKSTEELSRALGKAYESVREGGITGEEAAGLVSSAGLENMVTLAGSGSSASEATNAALTGVAELIARQNQVLDTISRTVDKGIVTQTTLADRVLRDAASASPNASGPAGNPDAFGTSEVR